MYVLTRENNCFIDSKFVIIKEKNKQQSWYTQHSRERIVQNSATHTHVDKLSRSYLKAFGTIFFFLFLTQFSFSQNETRNEVKKVVDNFIKHLNNQDVKNLTTLLDPSVGLMTIFYEGAKSILTAESLEMFLQNIEDAKTGSFQEELLNYRINYSNVMATVWCEYNFFYDNAIHHCGENAFQLYKSPKGWKIIQITDTRYQRRMCNNSKPTTKYERKASLIKFIDKWHKNASESNGDQYFDAIADDGVYIGTAPGEFWTKEEFKNWVLTYLGDAKMWHFETIDRHIYFNNDEDLAWFNENLETSMGICHATGVANFSSSGWKIQYYQLSVTVPNELMTDFMQLKNKHK
jgi:hypothetical protein